MINIAIIFLCYAVMMVSCYSIGWFRAHIKFLKILREEAKEANLDQLNLVGRILNEI